MKFHFVVVVWGSEYVRLFLDLVLPTQLTPGNLGAFAGLPGARYRIYTTPGDAAVIRAAPTFRELNALVETDIVEIDARTADAKEPYAALSTCHQDAVRHAVEESATLVFLTPDSIWSEGTFRRLRDLLEAGIAVVLVAAIRVDRDAFVADLGERSRDATLSPELLVELALQHPHPTTSSLFWGAECSNSWPSHLYWRVGDHGLLARCFHMHPLLIQAPPGHVELKSTIDDDFVHRVCPDGTRIHLVVDSDEIMGCELSATQHVVGSIDHQPTQADRVAEWMVAHTNPHHRRYARSKIRFHSRSIDDDWREVEAESDRVLGMLGRAYNRIRWRARFDSHIRPIGRRLGVGYLRRRLRSLDPRNT